jgi:N-acetylmuramoyl-L-alanine amidase
MRKYLYVIAFLFLVFQSAANAANESTAKAGQDSSIIGSLKQKAILDSINKAGYRTGDQGVKHAPFYVLIGTKMPSILIEPGYMTNAAECRQLFDKKYQEQTVNGIIEGINNYVAGIFEPGDNLPE